jgi:hypothetical protein
MIYAIKTSSMSIETARCSHRCVVATVLKESDAPLSPSRPAG